MMMMIIIIIIIIIIMPVYRNVRQNSIKETKIQQFMYGDTTNVECETHDYTCNKCGHRNGNISFKEKLWKSYHESIR
jgi:hypothetical protein